MSVLLHKSWRDVFKLKGFYLCIALMSLLGLMFYSGLSAVRTDLKQNVHEFYDSQKLADYTIVYNGSLESSKLAALASSEEISGCVYGAYLPTAIVHFGKNKYKAQVYFIYGGFEIVDIPNVRDGAMPELNGALIDYSFGDAKGYSTGTTFTVEGFSQTFTISGTAEYPDKIYKSMTKIPDALGEVVLKINRSQAKYGNYAAVTTSLDKTQLTQLMIGLGASADLLQIVDKANGYSYSRVEDDLDLVGGMFSVLPSAMLAAVLFIIVVNYAKVVDRERRTVGLLKAQGFGFLRITAHYMLFPIAVTAVFGVIGSVLGVVLLPKIYFNVLCGYYCLPAMSFPVTASRIILPTLLLTVASALTVAITCSFTLAQPASELMRNVRVTRGVKLFGKGKRKGKGGYTLKLAVRNALTYYKKTVALVLCLGLTIGILFSVSILEDSVRTGVSTASKLLFNGDYVLNLDSEQMELFEAHAQNDGQSVFGEIYYFCQYNSNVKTRDRLTEYNLFVYDADAPVINVKNEKSDAVDLSGGGLFLPYLFRDNLGYSEGEEIGLVITLGGYSFAITSVIGGFYRKYSELDVIIDATTLENSVAPELKNYVTERLKNGRKIAFTLKNGYTVDDVSAYLNGNSTPLVESDYRYDMLLTAMDYGANICYYDLSKHSEEADYPFETVIPRVVVEGEFLTGGGSASARMYIYSAGNCDFKLYKTDGEPVDTDREIRGIYVSSAMSEKYGIYVGDSFSFKNDYDGETAKSLFVSGIVDSADEQFMVCNSSYFSTKFVGSILMLSGKLGRKFTSLDGLTSEDADALFASDSRWKNAFAQSDFTLKSNCSLKDAERYLTALGGETKFVIYTKDKLYTVYNISNWSARISQISNIIGVTKLIAYLLSGILAMALLYNVCAISLADRMNDYKIFKALGMPERSVNVITHLENYLTMLVGFALAALLGALFASGILERITYITTIEVALYIKPITVIMLFVVTSAVMLVSNALIDAKANGTELSKLLKEDE